MSQTNEDEVRHKLDEILATAEAAKVAVNVRSFFKFTIALFFAILLWQNHGTTNQIRDVSAHNKANGDLLVNCTTPGPNPPPHSGNDCWDRLHDPAATSAAVALIVDDVYCDQRRAQHKLPAVPDPRVPCRDQTPADVYPGQ